MQGGACFKCRTEMLRLALAWECAFGENQEEVWGIKNDFLLPDDIAAAPHKYVDAFPFVKKCSGFWQVFQPSKHSSTLLT